MSALPARVRDGALLAPTPLGAVRRTTTLTVTPDGDWNSGRTVWAIGRDLARTSDAAARTRHDVLLIDVDRAGLITASRDGQGAPAQLLGLRAQQGLRKAIAQIRSAQGDGDKSPLGAPGGLCDAMLDDVVGTLIASGYGRLHQGPLGPLPGFASRMSATCVGFSTMHRRGEEFDSDRYFTGKPRSIEFVSGDPLAWHNDPAMAPNTFRRRRMLQVQPGTGDTLAVAGYFRDTFATTDGVERVVHEYGVTATLSTPQFIVEKVEAHPGDLPLPACPLASRSASTLIGVGAADIDAAVRHLAGPGACTHLNDELRSLRLVPALADFRSARSHR